MAYASEPPAEVLVAWAREHVPGYRGPKDRAWPRSALLPLWRRFHAPFGRGIVGDVAAYRDERPGPMAHALEAVLRLLFTIEPSDPGSCRRHARDRSIERATEHLGDDPIAVELRAVDAALSALSDRRTWLREHEARLDAVLIAKAGADGRPLFPSTHAHTRRLGWQRVRREAAEARLDRAARPFERDPRVDLDAINRDDPWLDAFDRARDRLVALAARAAYQITSGVPMRHARGEHRDVVSEVLALARREIAGRANRGLASERAAWAYEALTDRKAPTDLRASELTRKRMPK